MITKKSTKGKIVIELKSSGHHFTLTKNNIRGLHGSFLTSEDDTGVTLRITSSGAGAVTTAQAGAEANITSSEATDTPSFEGDVVTTSLDLEGTQISITASELTDTDITSTTQTLTATETPVTSSHNEDRSICITPPGDDEKMRPRSIVISSREDLVKACQDIDADSISITSSESTETKTEDDADEMVSITSSEASDVNVTSTTDTEILSNVPFGATAIPPNDVIKTSTNAAISITPSLVAQIHPQSTESTSRYSKNATSFTVMPFGDRNAPNGTPHAQPMKIHVHVHVHMH